MGWVSLLVTRVCDPRTANSLYSKELDKGKLSYKDLKKVCADLKTIYSAATEEAGLEALVKFGEKWDYKYPMISQSWQRHWDDLSEFFKYPPEIRRTR